MNTSMYITPGPANQPPTFVIKTNKLSERTEREKQHAPLQPQHPTLFLTVTLWSAPGMAQ